MKYNYVELGKVIKKIIDYRGKTPKKLGGDWVDSGIRVISAKNVHAGKLDNLESIRYVNAQIYSKWMKDEIQKNDILLASEGASMGESLLWNSNEKVVLGQRIFCIRCDEDIINPYYLAMYMQTPEYRAELRNHATGTAVFGLRQTALLKTKVRYVSKEMQNVIGNLYYSINEKININAQINKNLLEQVLTLYRNKFVDTVNKERIICRTDEYFDISIGKTPPRKEPQWFSTNPQDITWVSISDMGTCGLYISSSSEQLTKEAVEHHNVKVVPDNTVILSFKLTVGRIAITNGEMATNEAIAHFKTEKKEINEYLYCYLKCFNYKTMGSTSSIATAVNSKIIKGMPFVVPTNDELEEFHGFAAPMFAKIKANQIETDNLTVLRDTLLPKLMSGELDVSCIDF